MIDMANDNLDNELNIEKYNKLHEIMKTEIEKKLKEEFIKEGCNGITKLPKEFMINKMFDQNDPYVLLDFLKNNFLNQSSKPAQSTQTATRPGTSAP